MGPIIFKTKERVEIVERHWSTTMRAEEILVLLNATDGPKPVVSDHLRAWASNLKLKRPIELLSQLRIEAYQQSQNFQEAKLIMVDPESPDWTKLHQIVTPNWSYEQLKQLCDYRRDGLSTIEIGLRLKTTKNAVVGKMHRLEDFGFLVRRPIRNAYREPGNPHNRPSRAKSKPLTTLPPLASAEPVPEPVAVVAPIVPKPSPVVVARPMLVDFRAAVPRPLPTPRLLSDAPASETGPSMKPCQWVVQVGSVIVPWVHCGVDREKWPYCHKHLRAAWNRAPREAA